MGLQRFVEARLANFDNSCEIAVDGDDEMTEESKTTIMDVLRWGYWRVRFALCGIVCRFVGHDEKCDEVWAGDQRMR